jgi:hypothetical protein
MPGDTFYGHPQTPDGEYGETWRLHVRNVLEDVLQNRNLTFDEIEKIQKALKDSWDLIFERRGKSQDTEFRKIIKEELTNFAKGLQLTESMRTEVSSMLTSYAEKNSDRNFGKKNANIGLFIAIGSLVVSAFMYLHVVSSGEATSKQVEKLIETLKKPTAPSNP